MQELKARIRERIEERNFCTIFQNDLERVFPVDGLRTETKKAIEKFANENGWQVKISDAGIRATFKKK
jgi:hypothetical protein